ncbi:hypothetical protein [Pseudomonas sp. 22 E 5]|nr:hypothetical protein [Pseudomonas sp. 22 E 5]
MDSAPANSRQIALSTRLTIATRLNCANCEASGHCAAVSWAKRRSNTNKPKANARASAAPMLADCPSAAAGKARFQNSMMLISASNDQPHSHSTGAPTCDSTPLPNRLSARANAPTSSPDASISSAVGVSSAWARQSATHHADCNPATSTSKADAQLISTTGQIDSGANSATNSASTQPATARAVRLMPAWRNRRA